jgi:hypothetical protein
MSTVADSAAILKKEAEEKFAEAERLLKLQQAFPDIQKHVGRWNKIAYYTKSVNSLVDNYEARHNCGCCSDSPLEIWPYLQTEHGRIYSEPACFMVGRRNPYDYEDEPIPGWESKLSSAGIQQSLIEKISYLMKSEESSEEDEESDG